MDIGFYYLVHLNIVTVQGRLALGESVHAGEVVEVGVRFKPNGGCR